MESGLHPALKPKITADYTLFGRLLHAYPGTRSALIRKGNWSAATQALPRRNNVRKRNIHCCR
jgi:hypothetical protein